MVGVIQFHCKKPVTDIGRGFRGKFHKMTSCAIEREYKTLFEFVSARVYVVRNGVSV
jgi:hypothetical protein